MHSKSFPGGSDGKESACNAGDPGSTPGSGRSPGEENGYPLQYSCLENPIDRGAWWATAYGVAKSQTQLSNFYRRAILILIFCNTDNKSTQEKINILKTRISVLYLKY